MNKRYSIDITDCFFMKEKKIKCIQKLFNPHHLVIVVKIPNIS